MTYGVVVGLLCTPYCVWYEWGGFSAHVRAWHCGVIVTHKNDERAVLI